MDNDTLAGKKYKKLRVHSYSLLRNCTKLLIIKAFEACTLKFIGRLKEFLSCILIDKFDKSTIGDKIVETLYLNRVFSENKRIRTPPLSPPFKVGVFVVFYR